MRQRLICLFVSTCVVRAPYSVVTGLVCDVLRWISFASGVWLTAARVAFCGLAKSIAILAREFAIVGLPNCGSASFIPIRLRAVGSNELRYSSGNKVPRWTSRPQKGWPQCGEDHFQKTKHLRGIVV